MTSIDIPSLLSEDEQPFECGAVCEMTEAGPVQGDLDFARDREDDAA
jgi:hypothetical protein